VCRGHVTMTFDRHVTIWIMEHAYTIPERRLLKRPKFGVEDHLDVDATRAKMIAPNISLEGYCTPTMTWVASAH
jgi:hypothetical protein